MHGQRNMHRIHQSDTVKGDRALGPGLAAGENAGFIMKVVEERGSVPLRVLVRQSYLLILI